MRLLAIAADSNAAVRFRQIARCNPGMTWDCVTVREDAVGELYDWTKRAHHLALRDRWVEATPQGEVLPDILALSYERACGALALPLNEKFLWYAPALLEMVSALRQALSAWEQQHYDALVLWSQWCWYNEVAKGWARERGIPIIYVERASFPGMLIVDGTGLAEGHSDLELYAGMTVGDEDYRNWLSLATSQAIEPQRLTTPGQVRQALKGRRTTFVPLQMPYDTNMVFRAGAICTNDGLLDWVDIHRKADEQIIVKKHPADWFTSPAALEAKCAALDFRLVDFAVHPLLEQVDHVATINSQVGIEAWMHGVPVTFLGQPSFRLAGLTPQRNIEALLAYYIAPAQFTQRAREIIARQKGGAA